jgi:hypothetical protein
VTYRAELSERVLRQLGGFPAKAFDALIATMALVVEYPDDPMRTFPTANRMSGAPSSARRRGRPETRTRGKRKIAETNHAKSQ